MTDTALSETAMLSSLRDIRLPSEAAGGLAADIAVTMGLAGLAALAVAVILRLLSRQRRPMRGLSVKDRLSALRSLPDADRRVGLLHLLRDHAPRRYAALRRDLYVPGGAISIAVLEAEVARFD